MTTYGITRELPDLDFAAARQRVTETLKAEGFGIITEIDVQATMKAKLGVDFRPYAILGACNPPIAHQALLAEPLVGLLLPCNVVVMARDGGGSIVSVLNPTDLFALVGRPDVEPLAREVRARLERALAAV
jgi:uncharacterized protein (DUF302 family)